MVSGGQYLLTYIILNEIAAATIEFWKKPVFCSRRHKLQKVVPATLRFYDWKFIFQTRALSPFWYEQSAATRVLWCRIPFTSMLGVWLLISSRSAIATFALFSNTNWFLRILGQVRDFGNSTKNLNGWIKSVWTQSVVHYFHGGGKSNLRLGLRMLHHDLSGGIARRFVIYLT